jgi:asparagine synthase (glutamine-hydrolysing)
MCGINVILDPERALADPAGLVRSMTAQMAYRGPDGEGFYSEGPLAMGMRRLSIIDLPGGQQPLYNEDRSLALICNGEIYNHSELRAALIARGHAFATQSDCEPILHLYEDLGPRCLAELRGMFAFALWDSRRQRLFAARDRLGIKPLYLYRRGRLLALSSELKALIRKNLAGAGCSIPVLADTLHYTFPISDRETLAREIERVPPGHYLEADHGSLRLERYWAPAFGSGDPAPTDPELLASFGRAVEVHLRSDVPVAVLLSAGIDSAAIAALARRSGSGLVALCAGYRGSHDSDERAQAGETAQVLGLPFRELELDAADYPRAFEEIVSRCDEPATDIASVAQWALYRACRAAGFSVVLSGLGGDELFFGYPGWNELGERMAHDPRAPGGTDGHGTVQRNASAAAWLGIEALRLETVRGEGRVRAFQAAASRGPDAVYSFLLKSYLVNNGLQLADKLGMGNSVEVRVPFLDNLFVEQVIALPLQRRFRSGATKPLLRQMLAPLLGPRILGRPKRGFEPPPAFVRTIVQVNAERLLDAEWLGAIVSRDRLAGALRTYLKATEPSGVLRSQIRRAAGRLRLRGRDPRSLEWWLYSLTAAARTVGSWRRE